MLNAIINVLPIPGLQQLFNSTPRKPFDLPQEIIDSILDHLAQTSDSDPVARKTLRSCLLVSRAFNRRAQQNLLLDISLSQGEYSPERLAQLLAVLRREPSSLARLRSLKVYTSHLSPYLPNGFIAEATEMAFTQCRNLQHLTVSFDDEGARLSSLYHFYARMTFNITTTISRTRLTSLVLIQVTELPISSVLSSCSHLERLDLVRCHFEDEEAKEGVQDPPPFYRTLETLYIANENNELFSKIPAVARGEKPVYSSLRSLKWEFSTAADTALLNMQLESAPHLESLELTHRTSDLQPPDISTRVLLSRRQNLRTLTLNIIHTSPQHSLAEITDCKMFNAYASCATLETININVTTFSKWHDIEDFMEDDHSGWRHLDANLSNHRLYPGLTRINFRFHLLPMPSTTLPSLAELKTEFSVLYRFRRLSRREGVKLTASVTRG
ncbi:hypothetical protein BJ165DRAFT_1510188 [Panaeolus papilionaceus]|nr:hypothetical protein BJ165DRAFT_1510188 [Panaeolus papilionaceus]